jgi:uncharacterized MAPEG superfamily protein
MDNPSPKDKPQSPWAHRLYFAHTNAVDNLVTFAPLVLILNTLDISTRTTAIACAVYFWARLAHAIVYAMGLPVFPDARLLRRLPRAGGAGARDLPHRLIIKGVA